MARQTIEQVTCDLCKHPIESDDENYGDISMVPGRGTLYHKANINNIDVLIMLVVCRDGAIKSDVCCQCATVAIRLADGI